MTLIAMMLLGCGGTGAAVDGVDGERGIMGPEGPPGPPGPEGPAGAGPTAQYHWVDEAGDVAIPGPFLTLFNQQGVGWNVDSMSGDIQLPPDVQIYYDAIQCTGTAYAPVYGFNVPMQVLGDLMVLPPDALWIEIGDIPISSSEYANNGCVDAGFGATNPRRIALIADLIPAGAPPTVTWSGGLHQVEGPP